MHVHLLIPLLSGATAAALAGAMLARDPGHRANRLLAGILGCGAGWCFLEVLWNPLRDPEWVLRLIRLSSFFWVPLGAMFAHLFVELGGDPRRRLRRGVPALYGVAAAGIAVYVATPWGVAGVVATPWGWSPVFGPLFPVVFLPTVGAVVATLAFLWRRVYPRDASPDERREARWALAGVLLPLLAATLTDVVLPALGHAVPRLGSATLVAVGAVVARNVHAEGHAVLAPSSYAGEIFSALREGVALLRRDGRIRLANGSLARLLGTTPDALVGRRLAELVPELAEVPEGGAERECDLVAEGRRIPVAVSCSELRDRQDARIGVVAVVRDLQEVMALRSRLITSGRLAAVGELAAGIAHEINNPVAFVGANLRQLARTWQRVRAGDAPHALADALGEGEAQLAECIDGVERIAGIVRDVAGFSHASGPERSLGNLNQAVASALRMAAPQLRYAARVEAVYGDVPVVSCHLQQMKQVFLDVILNARHAIGEAGSIRIATQRMGGHVVVCVEDDGCGMTPEVAERVFDPFFTTKDVGEGTGLGLSLSYQIVREHGGDIAVASEPGKGTCVRIRLPVPASEPEPAREAAAGGEFEGAAGAA